MPKDSLQSVKLLSNLNEFIHELEPNNKRIDKNYRISTLALMDDFNGVQKSVKFNDDDFYKPYLNNIVSLSDSTFLVQLSYIGVNNNIPIRRASFDLVAYQNGSGEYTFSSPLSINTKSWKTKEIENLTVCYKEDLNEESVQAFINKQHEFNKKLGITSNRYLIYCCSNSMEAQKVLGLSNKSDYNGRSNMSMSYNYNDTTIMVTNIFGDSFDHFDAHDLFHWCAAKAVNSETYNHYMVCAGGYVYGGSWGLSWDEIKEKFKTKMLNSSETDWLKLYVERYNFGDSQSKHLLVTQFINALIIEQIEKEKGFSGVMELLNSGNFRKDRVSFFKELDRITGINESNFNTEVKQLFSQL